jgi:hypothetical protein
MPLCFNKVIDAAKLNARNKLAARWKAIYDFDSGAAIWLNGVSMTASEWKTIDGKWSWVQTSAPERPSVVAGGLSFNGTSSNMVCDQLAVRANRQFTILIGARSVAGTGSRCLITMGDSTPSPESALLRLDISNTGVPGTSQKFQASRTSPSEVVSVALSTEATAKGSGPWDLAISKDQTVFRASRIANPLVQIGSDTATPDFTGKVFSRVTLGARRLFDPIGTALFFQGVVPYVIFGSRKWSDEEILLGHAALVAEGLIV